VRTTGALQIVRLERITADGLVEGYVKRLNPPYMERPRYILMITREVSWALQMFGWLATVKDTSEIQKKR
jgi:hypothetical protein